MSRAESGVCDFHFIMDTEMKDDLMELDMFAKGGSFSRLIVDILALLSPVVEKEHFFGKERASCYEFVNDDLEIPRESVHVYLPGGLYRRLKLMHQDLNFYSIAGLVRFFLRFFLVEVGDCRGDEKRKIEELVRRWKKTKIKKFSRESMRQLWQFISKKPAKIRLINLYNHLFSPIKIYRL